MTDRKQPDPMAAFGRLFPGVAWGQAVLEGTSRAQARLAADSLRQLNAPMVEALARQRELLDGLEEAARGLRRLAEQMESVTRRYAELTTQTQAALEPYLQFVDWLAAVGNGEAPH
jgi:hypothetical protein